jgi:hypothetical protein
MKFMFMIYHDQNVLDALPEEERQSLVDSALDYDEEIRRSGYYIVSHALQPARTARTIRVRGGKVATTDGPFAETKEQAATTRPVSAFAARRAGEECMAGSPSVIIGTDDGRTDPRGATRTPGRR